MRYVIDTILVTLTERADHPTRRRQRVVSLHPSEFAGDGLRVGECDILHDCVQTGWIGCLIPFVFFGLRLICLRFPSDLVRRYYCLAWASSVVLFVSFYLTDLIV